MYWLYLNKKLDELANTLTDIKTDLRADVSNSVLSTLHFFCHSTLCLLCFWCFASHFMTVLNVVWLHNFALSVGYNFLLSLYLYAVVWTTCLLKCLLALTVTILYWGLTAHAHSCCMHVLLLISFLSTWVELIGYWFAIEGCMSHP